MEVHFPPDLQEKLVHSAAKQGRDAEELVQDMLTRYLAAGALIQTMRGYDLTPLARADIFEIWAHIADDETSSRRVAAPEVSIRPSQSTVWRRHAHVASRSR